MRRTADAGRTWSDAVELAPHGIYGKLASVGQMLDVVWIQNGRVRYAHSDDGGATLEDAIALSQRRHVVEYTGLAHHPNGFVGIAWVDSSVDPASRNVFLRRSLDNGATLLPAEAVADTGRYSNPIQLAVGDGVVYLGYVDTMNQLRIKRSLDWGAHWSHGVVVGRAT